jgi:hypothetical protein
MSTLVVVITALNDWISSILVGCIRVSTIVTFYTLGEVVLTLVQQCSNLWLPINILCGVECGCEYISSFLLVMWTNGHICQLCAPTWFPNSMPFNLF